MKFTEPKKYNINDVSIHPEANATPVMTREQYDALKIDIEKNGQIEPVIMFRGKIVDGRHRYKILNELDRETITGVSMPNNSTIDDIKSLVKSKEIHRHQTPTQLAIYAYRQMLSHNSNSRNKDKNMTQADAAKEFGVVVKQIGRVARIDNKLMRPDILDLLFDGNKFNIGTKNRPILTDSLQSVINYLDRVNAEQSNILSDIVFDEKLTEEDNLVIAKIMNIARDQKRIVREALSKKLYAELNDTTEDNI